MRIVFNDESGLDVVRVFKSYDFATSEIRLSIEMTSPIDIESILDKDFSELTLERSGMNNVVFEGYHVVDVQETYDVQGYNFTLNLTK